jgi:hypothetical protein
MNLRTSSRASAPTAVRGSAKRALFAWSALVAVAFIWGRVLTLTHHNLLLGAPPFFSPWGFHLSARIVPAIVLATIGVRFGPDVARRASWTTLLAACAATSWAWAAAIAKLSGPRRLTVPLSIRQFGYLQTAVGIHSLGTYLPHFVDKIGSYSQDTIGHPPAMVVIEWLLLQLGIATPGWNAVLVVTGGAVAGVAALVALREITDEATARRAAPFVALVPAVIWWQTADAFFAGVSATAVMLIVLASGRRGRRADFYALAGGLAFGLTFFLSYGLAPLALLAAAVCIHRRTVRPIAIAAAGIVPWFVGFAIFGFSWFAGFFATRNEYWNPAGAASHRPYSYFLIANLAVFAIATGPAVTVGITRIRDRRMWPLVGSILAVVALVDLTGMSKGEVERIWLPFVPWAMLATGALTSAPNTIPASRKWLALQTTTTLLIAVAIRSQW